MPIRRRIQLSLALALSVGGCLSANSEGADPGGDPYVWQEGDMVRIDSCSRTECDDCNLAVTDDRSACIDSCLLFLGGSGAYPSCVAGCFEDAEQAECPVCDEDPACTRRSFEFAAARWDPLLLEACDAAVARDATCGESTVGTDCARFAHHERPEHAEVYRCLANTPCGADASRCGLPSGDLGTEMCAASRCADDFYCFEVEEAMNDLEPWLRRDVVEALRTCKQVNCDEMRGCIHMWAYAIFGYAFWS